MTAPCHASSFGPAVSSTAAVGPSAARRAADAVVQALDTPRLSLEALRLAVVRYGRIARELALAPDEMLGTLVPTVQRSLATHPEAARGPEIESWVQWWAIHGYHRAD